MTPLELANVVLRTMEIEAKSFDHIAYYQDNMVKRFQLKRMGKVPTFPDLIWDFGKYQKKNRDQALDQAVIESKIDCRFARVLDLAFYWSNDLNDWAIDVTRQSTWHYNFISHTEYDADGDYKKYTIWDETQAYEMGRYDKWVQCIFHLEKYAKQLNYGYEEE